MSIPGVKNPNFDNVHFFNSIYLPYKMSTVKSYVNAIGVVMNYNTPSNKSTVPLIKMGVFFRDLRK